MLGGLLNTNLPFAPNAWKLWVDHIMKHKKDYNFKKASLVYESGATAYASLGFVVHPAEVMRLKLQFERLQDFPEKAPETVVIRDKTYMVKSADPAQIVAWNGSKYYIICRSSTMLIIVLCESRSKVDAGAQWLRKINTHLKNKNF